MLLPALCPDASALDLGTGRPSASTGQIGAFSQDLYKDYTLRLHICTLHLYSMARNTHIPNFPTFISGNLNRKQFSICSQTNRGDVLLRRCQGRDVPREERQGQVILFVGPPLGPHLQYNLPSAIRMTCANRNRGRTSALSVMMKSVAYHGPDCPNWTTAHW